MYAAPHIAGKHPDENANTMSKYTNKTEAKRDEIYRSMSGEQKLRIAYELYLFARKIVESSIREYFPDISSEELSKKMIERFYR